MKLLIAGSRTIENFSFDGLIPTSCDTILSGGAAGIDSLAEQFADTHKLSKIILRPQYSLYGRAAPLRRNEELVRIADEILVVWDGKSRGTLHTIKYAKKKGKSLKIINYAE